MAEPNTWSEARVFVLPVAWMTLRITPHENPDYRHVVADFEVFEICAADNERCENPRYELAGSEMGFGSDGGTTELDKATSYVCGSIKWDGCINYQYEDASECLLHQCGLAHWASLNEAMKEVYKRAAECMGREALDSEM